MVKDEMATKEHQVSRFAALRARLASRRARDQRGSVLVEALIMAAVGALAMGGYLAVTTSTQSVVRHHQSVDIVDQYATGQIEKMRALPWAAVANCSGDATNAAPDGLSNDWNATRNLMGATEPAVYHSTTTCPTRYLTFYEVADVQNVKVKVFTRVSWANGSAASNPTLAGQKKVTLTLRWKPVGSPSERVRTITAFRSSTPTEADANTLPLDGAPL